MSDETPSREGELLAGTYRLQTRLGFGGLGEVYRARDELVGRDVAIKVLRAELCRHAEVVRRFMREARVASTVRHHNVVDVIDLGTDDHNVPFIVQELLVGQDLAHYLAARRNRLSVEEILALMIPVVDAIATAHQHGVVHRDLKPANVFLTTVKQSLVPKVLDFGIAEIVQPGEEKLTATGTAMGSPTYMSPEQLQGASDLDARADVWALGVIFYELSAGVLPFSGPSAGAIFVNICTRDPAPLSQHVPEVSGSFARIVERCLRRDLAMRYPTAAALLCDLRHLQQQLAPIEATGTFSPDASEPLAPGARSEIERLPLETGSHTAGTTPPVLPSPPTPRRTAVFVGSSAAVVAAISIAAVAFGTPRARATDASRAAAALSALRVVEPAPAVIAAPAAIPTPAIPADPPTAPPAPTPVAAITPLPALPTPEAIAPRESASRRAHGRHRATLPPSTATVALPELAATPHTTAPSGVGTTAYE